jgi:hypothetical protein
MTRPSLSARGLGAVIIALPGVRFEPDPDARRDIESAAKAGDEGETDAEGCVPCA